MPRLKPSTTPETFASFGDLLKYLRRRAHLTQRDLSIAVGYSEPQISYLETNRRVPDVATVAARFVPALDLSDEPALARRLVELAEAARREVDPAPGEPPFKGLHYFDEADADRFFGREEVTARLVTRLVSGEPFLAVIGASGSGKSSVMRAGLAPALRRQLTEANTYIHVITPTAHPMHALAGSECADVLVVDQFEELFTLCDDEEERDVFIDHLLAPKTPGGFGRRVVIALRADFYAECAQYAALREAVAHHQEYIGAMSPAELRRAVEQPARRSGWEFEPGLVDLVLRDTGAEPGALPLLSHALVETWTRRRGRTLTVSGYLASGGVHGAIAETAETVFNDELDPVQRTIARNIFLRLTELGEGVQATRRRATLNELILRPDDGALVEAVLARLTSARLITTSEATAEIAHEALIREWPTLRQWLIDDRENIRLHRQLATAAQAWESGGRQLDELYRGGRLARALEWAAAHTADMNGMERAFLDAAREQAEREQIEREQRRQRELEVAQQLAEAERRRAEESLGAAKRLRRRAYWLATASALAILLAALALFFGYQSNQNAAVADANAQQARSEQQIATARELAASAISNLPVDPERSMLLALHAVNTSLHNGQPVLIEAQDALHRSMQASRVLATLRGHTGEVMGLAVSPDGTRLATASDDGSVRIWDATTGKEVSTIPIGVTGANMLRIPHFSPDGRRLVAPTGDHRAKVWDAASGQEVLTLSGHGDDVTAAAFSPDGERIATTSWDRTAKLWDAATGKELVTFTGNVEGIDNVVFSPDGKRLYTGNDGDGYVLVWDVATGQEVFRFDGQGNNVGVKGIAVSPDGARIATAEGDTTVKVWEAATGALALTLFGHASYPTTVAFSADGAYLASASEDGTAKIWDATTGKERITLAGHTSGLEGAAFSPDGNRLYTAGRDGTVKIWDLSPSAGSDWLNLAGHTDRVHSVVYSPDGTRLVTWSADGSATVWDAATGQAVLSIQHDDNPQYGGNVSYSPDGNYVAVTSGNDPKIFDAVNGTEVLALAPFQADLTNVLFSPDGTHLAAAGVDGTVRLYDRATGKRVIEFKSSPTGVQQLAFSPDGKRLAVAGGDGAYVYDATTGTKQLTYSGHGEGVRSSGITFSPDGTWVASSGNDSTIKVWDSVTGADIFTLTGHTGPTFGVAFSADGNVLATSSVDRTVKVWQLPRPDEPVAEPLTLYGNTGAVYRVAFSPDGARLASAGRDHMVHVYALNIQDLTTVAQARLTRTLTPEECQKYVHMAQCPPLKANQ